MSDLEVLKVLSNVKPDLNASTSMITLIFPGSTSHAGILQHCV